MSDFSTELAARLTRNAELARERAAAEEAMDRAARDAEQAERDRQREIAAARLARHAELVTVLTELAERLKQASPDEFVVRLGWSASGEEFLAKISTRRLSPARTLLVELDRDDDEVLARWHSEVGNALELWRLLEVEAPLLGEMVLQVADQQLWQRASKPPPLPSS